MCRCEGSIRSRSRPSPDAQPNNHPRNRATDQRRGEHHRHRSNRWETARAGEHQIQFPLMDGSSSFRRFHTYFSSSVGTKLLIGITGLLLFAYLVLHLAGNALILAGPDLFNEYSHKLISNPLLIPIEIALLIVFLLHVFKAIRMVFANKAARPVDYAKKAPAGHTSRKSFASSSMIASGLVIFAFIVVHVKQF